MNPDEPGEFKDEGGGDDQDEKREREEIPGAMLPCAKYHLS